MEPSEYLAALRRRWLVLLVLAVLGGGVGYAMAASTTPTYRGTSSVWVSLGRGETVSELAQGSTYVQNLVQSYALLATTPSVLDPVIAELGLDQSPRALARSVSADTPLNSVFVQISAVSTDPEEAARIADAVAAQLAVEAQDLAPKDADGRASVIMRTVAPAQVPKFAFAPNTKLSVATGIVLGLIVGIVLALLRELTDTRVRSSRDVARVTTTPLLGSVGVEKRPKGEHFAVAPDGTRTPSEAYRRLATNLQSLEAARDLRSLVVTSAVPGDGTTTTAVNLGLALAEGAQRVLVLDANLRSPAVADHCRIDPGPGLTAVLGGRATVDEAVQPWGHPNLRVLPAGDPTLDPSQLLRSPAMGRLLDELGTQFDIVVIDSAPLLAAADAVVLAAAADGTVVVAGSRHVRRHDLAEALGGLQSVGATCLGVILNRVAPGGADTYDRYRIRTPRQQRGVRAAATTFPSSTSSTAGTAGTSGTAGTAGTAESRPVAAPDPVARDADLPTPVPARAESRSGEGRHAPDPSGDDGPQVPRWPSTEA